MNGPLRISDATLFRSSLNLDILLCMYALSRFFNSLFILVVIKIYHQNAFWLFAQGSNG